jgi:hypothetical protein
MSSLLGQTFTPLSIFPDSLRAMASAPPGTQDAGMGSKGLGSLAAIVYN